MGKNVFISYSSEDKSLAKLVTTYLKDAGIKSIWLDQENILAGQDISQRLISGIEDSACCILLLSERSLKSSWCMAEVGAFWGANKSIIMYGSQLECPIPPHLTGIRRANDPEELVIACREYLKEADEFEQKRITSTHSYQPDPLSEIFRQSGLIKAFRIKAQNHLRDDRTEELIAEECSRTEPKSFRLAASSGFSYVHPKGVVWQDLGLCEAVQSGVKFTVVLESPFSDYAKARALANRVHYHHWEEKTVRYELEKLAESDNVTINVTEHPLTCSLFITSNAALYDPYLWALREPAGRTENNFWVFEFRKVDDLKYDCYKLLEKHFDFLLSTSIPLKEFVGEGWDTYVKRTEEFKETMIKILKETK